MSNDAVSFWEDQQCEITGTKDMVKPTGWILLKAYLKSPKQCSGATLPKNMKMLQSHLRLFREMKFSLNCHLSHCHLSHTLIDIAHSQPSLTYNWSICKTLTLIATVTEIDGLKSGFNYVEVILTTPRSLARDWSNVGSGIKVAKDSCKVAKWA